MVYRYESVLPVRLPICRPAGSEGSEIRGLVIGNGMKHACIMAALAILCCPVAAIRAQSGGSGGIEPLRTAYQASLKKIENEAKSDLDAKLSQYGESLGLAVKDYQAKGDLDGLLAVKQEKERFDAQKSVPENPQDNASATVKRFQADYRQAVRKVELEKSKDILSLTDSYVQQLEGLKKGLTQQNKIEDALKAKAEIDEVRNSLPVSCAELALKTLGGATEPAKQAKTAPVPVSGPMIRVRCPVCGGSGHGPNLCKVCHGSGKCTACNGVGRRALIRGTIACTQCRGNGRCGACGGLGGDPCAECNGAKTVMRPISVPGTLPGQTASRPVPVTPSPPSSPPAPFVKTPVAKGEGVGDYSATVAALRKSFESGQVKDASLEDVIASPDKYKGQLIRSAAYLIEAFPRRVTVAGSTEGASRGGFNMVPDSVGIGEKAGKLVWSIKRSEKVAITYGVVNAENFTLFDIRGPGADAPTQDTSKP